MKKLKVITISFSSLFLLISCYKNDTLDDRVIVGQMAPQVYWELASTIVSAGSQVDFMAQYYTNSKVEIEKLELWYNVIEVQSKILTCPWVESFKYNYSSVKSEEKRIPQKIVEFQHGASTWDGDSLRAYVLNENFPVSATLSSVVWKTPESFQNEDSLKMNRYFGENFMQNFKDSLYTLMKGVDFRRMYLGMALLDDFKEYIDSTFNENTNKYEYHFPKENGIEIVPDTIKEIYQNIPFGDLIFDKGNSTYNVEYESYYKLNAYLKVVDKDGVAGVSTKTEITIN